mmetsp:Transcript_52426/g.135846  ORF Transcript_52426/g.135846 Transcript_52426/m.135846 type:complete len:205 (-) Transcript_52426:302-916(-)
MPSPSMRRTWPGLVTPQRSTFTWCPSRWVMDVEKPSSASRREICISVCSSLPARRKRVSFSTRSLSLTSPGIMPGLCSLARANVSSSPSDIPRRMCASRSYFACSHRSSEGTSCCCWMTKPGASCTFTGLISGGHSPQRRQRGRPEDTLPALRLQRLQTTRRVIVRDLRAPLNASASVTFISTLAWSPRCLLARSLECWWPCMS